MTDFNGHTEGTDMLVNLLADSQKLHPKDQRWYYDKNDKNNNDEIDDKFDDYVTHNDIPMNNQNTENNNYTQNNGFDDKTDQPVKSNTNKFIDEEYENLSPLEKRLRRLDIMRALGELRDLGCKVTNYNIDDDYYMMKYELDLHRSIRAKRNWLGLYSHMMIGVVKGVELLNNNYNPFDFSLKGLSDEVNADKNTYYEILGEIYEYHNVPGKKMNPWFRLMISLVGAVVMVGGKNNAHKFIPNKSEQVENDDEYIEKLRAKAAKDSQSQLSNNKNSQNNIQKQNHLDDYMNKQHEHAVQRAKDLEDLKKQELEYQKYQQMLSQNKDKFNLMKKSLEMTATASHRSSAKTPLSSAKKSSIIDSVRSSRSSRSKNEKKPPTDTMSEMSTSTNKTSESAVSQISINRHLANKLRQNVNKSKKSNDISLDQISFGSNKRNK